MTPIGRTAPVGVVPAQARPERAQMKTLPSSMIVLWVAGLSWAAAIAAYLLGGAIEWIFPLFMLGFLVGIAQWAMGRPLG